MDVPGRRAPALRHRGHAMLRNACLVFGATALHLAASDELLAVVVFADKGDLELATQSIKRWPMPEACSSLTEQNVDLVLYYAGGEEDKEAVSAAADTIAKSGRRCFANTRTMFAELEKKVRAGSCEDSIFIQTERHASSMFVRVCAYCITARPREDFRLVRRSLPKTSVRGQRTLPPACPHIVPRVCSSSTP